MSNCKLTSHDSRRYSYVPSDKSYSRHYDLKYHKKHERDYSRSSSRSRSRSRDKSFLKERSRNSPDYKKSYYKPSYYDSNKRDDKDRSKRYEKDYSGSSKYSSSGARYYKPKENYPYVNQKYGKEFDLRQIISKKGQESDSSNRHQRELRDEREHSSKVSVRQEEKKAEKEVTNTNAHILHEENQNISARNYDRLSEAEVLNNRRHNKIKIYKEDSEIVFKEVHNQQNKQPNKQNEESDFEMESEDEPKNFVRKNSKNIIMPVNKVPLNCSRIRDPREKICEKLQVKEKLNLVLDLDETFLNSASVSRNFDIRTLKHIPQDHIKEFDYELDGRRVILVLRPYFKEFLERISKIYNIFVYSHGRWDYVQKVLEVIDKEEKYIRRDLIFKNTGQVDKTTQKLVANLGLDEKEAEKTIILDDQKYIWGAAQKKVIPSKKFIPLKDFMVEEKYLRYMLFDREGDAKYDGPWCLSFKNDPFGLKSYAEFDFQEKTSQLEPLANLLEDISTEYNIRKLLYPDHQENLKIEALIEKRMKKIMDNWKVCVASSSNSRTKMFQELVVLLGGKVVEQVHAEYIFVDFGITETIKMKINMQDNPGASPTVISISWLIECFFSGHKIDLQNFYV